MATAKQLASPCLLSATDPADNGPGVPVVYCGEPSVAVITFACVHEHVAQPPACAACAGMIQGAAGDLVCPRCEDGAEPHECLYADVRISWATGEVTIVQAVTP